MFSCYEFLLALFVMSWSFVWVGSASSQQFTHSCSGKYRSSCFNKCVYWRFCDRFCLVPEHDCASDENCVDSSCVKSCRRNADCKDAKSEYQSCCNSVCNQRRYCAGFCEEKGDCAPYEHCATNQCVHVDKLPSKYCDSSKKCPSNEQCRSNSCVSGCSLCSVDEKCLNGECHKKDSVSFSSSSIIGFAAVVIIGSCIACVIYCGCARTSGRQHHRQQQQQQRQQQQQLDQLQNADTQMPDTPDDWGSPSPPLHPGGPPPYHSLEHLDQLEEPPPPTYQEAIRNSNNQLEV